MCCMKRSDEVEANHFRIFLPTWLVAILLTVFLSACAGSQSQQEDQKLGEATRLIGEAYMRKGDYTSALRELLKAKDLYPEDPIVYNDLGLCYMAKNMLPDAIVNFKKAVALKPA